MHCVVLRFTGLALALFNVQAKEGGRCFADTLGSSSMTERVLLGGYSSAEDCLFGTSSVLTRNVRFVDDDQVEKGDKLDGPSSHNAQPATHPAFIVNKPKENSSS